MVCIPSAAPPNNAMRRAASCRSMAMPAAQRHFAVVAGAVAVAVLAASLANVPGARANGLEQFPGPSDPADPEGVAAWLAQWRGWREATRKANNYTGAIYNVTQLAWTKTEYIQPQMHPYDQFFYNVTSRELACLAPPGGRLAHPAGRMSRYWEPTRC